MKRIDLDYAVIVALLLSSLYAGTTGLVMDLFGSHQFFWHNYAGYASAVLAGLHLALNWGWVSSVWDTGLSVDGAANRGRQP